MQRHTLLCLCFISIILFFGATHAVPTVTVGVVLDLDSWVGKVAKTAIELAADDVNRDTKLLNDTRLILAMYDSPHEDAIAGASAGERVVSSLGRLVIIVWLFVVLILTSSYTASLTSILTVQQMKPSIQDVGSLRTSGVAVGYQEGSFVKEYLIKQLGITNLKNYSTPEHYAEALSNGPNKGGVAAIFDEIPYIRVFLSGHCGYTIVGPTYKTGGFGFVFPKGSPVVSDISKAVLNLSESVEELQGIEEKWLNETACNSPGAQVASNRLSMKSFWGLYLITGLASVIALFIFLGRLCYDFGRDPSATAAPEIEMSQSKAVSISTRMKSFAKFADRKEPADGSAYGEGSNTPTSLTIITTSSLHDLDESDDGSAAENRVSARSSSVSRCKDEQRVLEGNHIF